MGDFRYYFNPAGDQRGMIPFVKIEATGNDFIVMDSTDLTDLNLSSELVSKFCDRHYGVGGDGLIILSPGSEANFRMKYFNRDGSPGKMCGNGLRASCLFAEMKRFFEPGTPFLIESDTGIHKAVRLINNRFRVQIIVDQSSLIRLDKDQNDKFMDFYPQAFIDTGVPHLILLEDGTAEMEYRRTCALHYRWQETYDSSGVNVNFVRKIGSNHIFVQTYERGVEDFTESCGSGVAAASIALAGSGGSGYPQDMIIDTAGGRLEIQFRNDEVYLCGPVRLSFTGQLII